MDQPVPHTDIRADGWIGRLPARLRPYALLAGRQAADPAIDPDVRMGYWLVHGATPCPE